MVGPGKEDMSPSLAYVRQCMPWPYSVILFKFLSIEVEYVYEDIIGKDVNRQTTYAASAGNRRGNYIRNIRRCRSSAESFFPLHVPISGTSIKMDGPVDVPGKLSFVISTEPEVGPRAGWLLVRRCKAWSVTWETGPGKS